eukprot:4450628-Pleurochrysis_carterae.AAC.7
MQSLVKLMRQRTLQSRTKIVCAKASKDRVAWPSINCFLSRARHHSTSGSIHADAMQRAMPISPTTNPTRKLPAARVSGLGPAADH